MRGSRCAVACLVAATLISSLAFIERDTSPQAKPIGQIAVSALGRQIELVSELGEPLEQLVTLHGEMVSKDHFKEFRRHKNPPDPARHVRVLRVGDRMLDEATVIELAYNWHRDKTPRPGAPVELIGYFHLVYEGDSPIDKQWEADPRNRHETPREPERARVVFPGQYNDRFVVLQFDELPSTP